MLRLSPTLLLAATFLVMMRDVSSERVVTCEDSKNVVQRLSCGAHGVISVEKTLYGRADKVTCSEGRSPSELYNTLCYLPFVLKDFRERCNGKTVCEVNIDVLKYEDPCDNIFKYLDTNYTCIKPNDVAICESSSAHLSCDEGQVLYVYRANYGRTDHTTCAFHRPTAEVQNVACVYAVSKVAESCNGKNSCTVTADNDVIGDPCIGTYKYLDVGYLCHYKEKWYPFTTIIWTNTGARTPRNSEKEQRTLKILTVLSRHEAAM